MQIEYKQKNREKSKATKPLKKIWCGVCDSPLRKGQKICSTCGKSTNKKKKKK